MAPWHWRKYFHSLDNKREKGSTPGLSRLSPSANEIRWGVGVEGSVGPGGQAREGDGMSWPGSLST